MKTMKESPLKHNMNEKEHLLAADGKNINRDIEEVEMCYICVCSIFGMK